MSSDSARLCAWSHPTVNTLYAYLSTQCAPCELIRARHGQGEHLELRQTLESERSRAEQDVLQLNLALSRREEEAVAMTSQLARTQATRELDTLSEQVGDDPADSTLNNSVTRFHEIRCKGLKIYARESVV